MTTIGKWAGAGLAVSLLILAPPAFAAPPPADTIIGNQAIATYKNAAGETITVQSNLVETIVNQVAGVSIAAPTDKDGAPGGKVFYPHTMTNDGNGPDTFDLTAVDADTGTLDLDGPVIYPDADLDGVPDTLTPITSTPSLAPGETFGIVVSTEIPAGAQTTDDETITVTATSQEDGTIAATLSDTVGVTTGANIEVTKSMSPSNAAAGDTLTITLTYSNTGLAAASNVVLEDDIPSELTYQPASGTWSDGGTLSDGLDGTDATNGVGDNIAYDFDGTAAGAVTVSIDNVPAGRSATVSFEAIVNGDAAGQVANIATYSVDGGPEEDTNVSIINVDDAISVSMADSSGDEGGAGLDGAAGTASGTDDGADLADDVVEEAGTYPQGGEIPFEFIVTNNSNVGQVFNFAADNIDFPADTRFSLTDAGGVPLTDSDGDGNPDLGPLAPGESASVFLRADLPNDDPVTAVSNPGWTATVTAAASSDPSVTNSSTAEFTGDITGASVDLQNAGNKSVGDAVADGGAAWTTETVDPGATATFDLVIVNTGPTASSYDLEWSGSNAPFTPEGDLVDGSAAPADDWQVRFVNASGVEVGNTGLIASGDTVALAAEVVVASDAPPGDTSIYFRAVSPTNAASDVKLDQVTVNEIVDLAVSPNQSTQAAPGGTVTTSHTLSNNGNSPIAEGAITLTGYDEFSGTPYLDVNENGVLDPADTPISNLSDIGGAGLLPGESVTIFSRVQVPSTAVSGEIETGTLAVDTTPNSDGLTDGETGNNQATSTVTIVSGDVELAKLQALDPGCDGNAGTWQAQQLQADPDQCVRYRVLATNSGTANAAEVAINDVVPAYTTYEDCGGACATVATDGAGAAVAPTTPAVGATGPVSVDYGPLTPGQQAVLEFTVRVDS